MQANDMTGLELMQAFARGLFPRPGISNVMPMEVDTIEHGRVVFTRVGRDCGFFREKLTKLLITWKEM